MTNSTLEFKDHNEPKQLELYANLLEAIKAMSDKDEAKALKAMLAVSRSVEQ